VKYLGHCPHDPPHSIDDLQTCQKNSELVRVEWSQIEDLATRTARYTSEILEMAYNQAIAEGHRELWMLIQKETT
jgi:hypothetical protein